MKFELFFEFSLLGLKGVGGVVVVLLKRVRWFLKEFLVGLLEIGGGIVLGLEIMVVGLGVGGDFVVDGVLVGWGIGCVGVVIGIGVGVGVGGEVGVWVDWIGIGIVVGVGGGEEIVGLGEGDFKGLGLGFGVILCFGDFGVGIGVLVVGLCFFLDWGCVVGWGGVVGLYFLMKFLGKIFFCLLLVLLMYFFVY